MTDQAQTQALTPYQERSMALREQMTSADPTAIVPRTFAEAQTFASAIAQSHLVPKDLRDNAPNVLMMVLAGAELGIAPIASLRVFHVIEGVPKLSADGIAALVMRSPLCEYLRPVVQEDDRVVWETKRRGEPKIQLEYTQADVTRAGLDAPRASGAKSNHVKFPRQMKNSRCKAELCRTVYPEICAGMLSAEEQHDVIEAEFVETTLAPLPVPSPVVVAAPETKTIDQAAPAPAAKPAGKTPLTTEQIEAFGNEMCEATNERDLGKVGARVGQEHMTDEQRNGLLKIFSACRDNLRRGASK